MMKTKLRLAMATVKFITKLEPEDGYCKLRFGQIGGGGAFDVDERDIINLEDINLDNEFIRIVTPERVSNGLFHSITFTREVGLP